MAEQLKYVSPEYQQRLDNLADLLVTQRRFGRLALNDTVDVQLELDLGEHIVLGEE